MNIRNTRTEDLEEVMRIYGRAARYMAETGNPNQWTPGYPPREMIEEDIRRGVSYVMEENGQIEAVFAYIEGVDLTYGRIENGAWLGRGSYATVHRLASAGRRRGIAGVCFAWCANQAAAHRCSSLRADTHRDNRVMQRVLLKNGFVYCGDIRLADGSPRLAYERLLWQGQGSPAGQPQWTPGVNQPQCTPGANQSQWAGNRNQTQQPDDRQKGDGIALGVASLVLGITSFLLFCTCVNVIMSITAIILGIIQISKNKEKVLAIAGISTGTLSLLMAVFLMFLFGVGLVSSNYYNSYDYYDSYDSYDNYYDGYDSYDSYDYYDEYDSYDSYYEEEGGQKLL